MSMFANLTEKEKDDLLRLFLTSGTRSRNQYTVAQGSRLYNLAE